MKNSNRTIWSRLFALEAKWGLCSNSPPTGAYFTAPSNIFVGIRAAAPDFMSLPLWDQLRLQETLRVEAQEISGTPCAVSSLLCRECAICPDASHWFCFLINFRLRRKSRAPLIRR